MNTTSAAVSVLELTDLERAARNVLPAGVADFIAGGAGDEITLRRERSAFDSLLIEPRVLTGTAVPDLATRILGCEVPFPIAVAPMGHHGLAHPEAELATIRGVNATGALAVAGTFSNVPMEHIAHAATGPTWFQVYCLRDRELTESLIRRAEAAGFGAIVVTCDVPRLGRRRRDMRNAFRIPAGLTAANLPARLSEALHEDAGGDGSAVAAHAAAFHDAALDWHDIAWIRSLTSLPIVLKGVLSPKDAALAVDAGAAGIIVSSHGGRQLDRAVAAVEALPHIAAAVGDRCEVFLDGGVRSGTDVLAALALGARAVFIGRPVLWALAAAGAQGVRDVLALLREELAEALMLAGRSGVRDVDGSLIWRR